MRSHANLSIRRPSRNSVGSSILGDEATFSLSDPLPPNGGKSPLKASIRTRYPAGNGYNYSRRMDLRHLRQIKNFERA